MVAPLHRLVSTLLPPGRKGRTPPKPLLDSWDLTCEQRFHQLKAALVSAPVLAFADFQKPFTLEVDASYGGSRGSALPGV